MENYVICQICGKQSTRIYGRHLKSHELTSEQYKEMYPDSPLCTEEDTKNICKNGGKHMKEEKYKKMFSEKFSGENNPNHKSKTTEEQRKRISPFSKDFYKYESEKERDDFVKDVLSKRKKKSFNTKIEYWLEKGFSQEEAEKQLSERQKTFTLEKCIEKYGEEKGQKIFDARQKKWKKSLIEGGNLKCGYSEISQELFYKILNFYRIENREKIYFATKNKEYFISVKGGEFYQYDYVDLKNNKIIEYNGDMYHANPDFYKEGDTPHPFRKNETFEYLREKDAKKLKAANDRGFEILTIWDSEYRDRPDYILQKCLEFLGL